MPHGKLGSAGKYYEDDRLKKYYWNVIDQKSFIYSLYYAEACNELAGLISTTLRPGSKPSFKEMSQRWRAIGNTVSDLTGPRFEPRTSRSRDKRITARPTNRSIT